jgi:hypothetical protein
MSNRRISNRPPHKVPLVFAPALTASIPAEIAAG